MLTPWSAAPERKVSLEVWGPDGTRDSMRHLEEAFAFDMFTWFRIVSGAPLPPLIIMRREGVSSTRCPVESSCTMRPFHM